MTGNEACMSLVSRGAMCVPLDDQENIICTMPSHIATRTVVAICKGRVRIELVVAICEGNSMRLHIAASWYLFLPRIQKIMTIGRWRAPLYSKHAAKLVQKSHCIVHSRTMVIPCRTSSVLMS